jgi:autotransporter-associated beta strand protein
MKSKKKAINLMAVFALSATATAQAGVIWDAGGGANTNINLNTNWDANALPDLTTGVSNLDFGTGGSTATINTNVSVNSITFSRTAAFTIADGAGTLTIGAGGITATVNQARTISESNITLGASQTWNIGANTTTVSSAITDGANSFRLTKTGSGALSLSGDNSFDGDLENAGAGAIRLSHNNAAGTGNILLNSTQTSTGITLQFIGGLTINNDIIMDSTTGRESIVFTGNGDSVMNGDMTINGASSNALIIDNSKGVGNGSVTWNGDITGLTYTGSVSLRGSSVTSYFNGAVFIASNLDHNSGGTWTVNAVGSNYVATRFQSQGTIALGGHNGLDTSARVIWNSDTVGGDLDMNGFNASVAGLDRPTTTTDPTVINNGSANSVLTLAALEADRSFAGRIIDGATHNISLVMNSAGRTQTLSGVNGYSGSTTVSGGILNVDGSLANNGANKIFIAKDANDDFTGSPELQRAVGALSSLAGIGATEVGGLGTVASLIGGATNGATSVDMAFRGRNNSIVAGETSLLSSDILQLEGLDGVVFVLQMSYSEAAALANGQAETTLRLGYLNTALNRWEDAVNGNHGVNTGTFFLSSWVDAGSTLDLGAYGVDVVNNVVWAVLDHNSFFAVIPTPGALPAGMLLMGLVVAAKRRRQA